jgi:hypothetical protein
MNYARLTQWISFDSIRSQEVVFGQENAAIERDSLETTITPLSGWTN